MHHKKRYHESKKFSFIFRGNNLTDAEKEAAEPERTAHSDRYMRLMLKAQIARNLFGIEYYYKVMKEVDDGYQRALEAIRKG